MKVLVKKNILESIVTNTNPYLEKRDLSSINSHILISAKNGILNIKATDHEIGLAYKITKNLEIIEDGEATANGKKLLDIIKSLKDGDIMLETVEKYLYIKQNNSKYKLPMQNASEFPSFPVTTGKSKFEINAGLLGKSLKKISPCIEISNTKPELTGALLDIKNDRINLVGTDTRRLSVYSLTLNSDKEFNIIIPKKAISEMQKLFFENIEIFYDENIFIATSENFEFFTKLINGKYPNYERVIPTEVKKSIKLNREKMIEGIKTISMLSEILKMTFNPENIVFESFNDDNSEAKTSIDCITGTNESFSLVVKSRFMLDFLTSIEESDFILGFNESTMPFIMVSGDLKTVVMPVNEVR